MPSVLGADSCIIACVIIVLPNVTFRVEGVSLVCNISQISFSLCCRDSGSVFYLTSVGRRQLPASGTRVSPPPRYTSLALNGWRKAWHHWSFPSTLKCSPKGSSKVPGHAGCLAVVPCVFSICVPTAFLWGWSWNWNKWPHDLDHKTEFLHCWRLAAGAHQSAARTPFHQPCTQRSALQAAHRQSVKMHKVGAIQCMPRCRVLHTSRKRSTAASVEKSHLQTHPLWICLTSAHQYIHKYAPEHSFASWPPTPWGEELTAVTAGKSSILGWQWWAHSPSGTN